MKSVLAIMSAVVAASLVPAIVFVLVFSVFDEYLTPKKMAFDFICAAAVSAAHTLCFGLPVCLALQKAGRFRLWSVGLSGFAIGAIPVATLLAIQLAADPSQFKVVPALFTVGFVGLLGTIGAACFYSVHTTMRRVTT